MNYIVRELKDVRQGEKFFFTLNQNHTREMFTKHQEHLAVSNENGKILNLSEYDQESIVYIQMDSYNSFIKRMLS